MADSRNYKKQKVRETQRLKSLKRTSAFDMILKKIQPPLSVRERIIKERRFKEYRYKKKERRDISKGKIQKSTEDNGSNKSNKDKLEKS